MKLSVIEETLREENVRLQKEIAEWRKPIDDEILESLLVRLEMNEPITDQEYFNLKKLINTHRKTNHEIP